MRSCATLHTPRASHPHSIPGITCIPATTAIVGWLTPSISKPWSDPERLSSIHGKEHAMEYRFLGRSGLKVSVLSFGAGTFGGSGPLFGAWGNTDAAEARCLVDICLDAGV